ncbi:hypothetical protein BX266_7418 [Streptomyces sp. TLI_171]|nr:hypothetical protein BX266_7418 [Streptomyces sp. TLI_171]
MGAVSHEIDTTELAWRFLRTHRHHHACPR